MTDRWERSLNRRPVSTTIAFLALGVVATFALVTLGWGLMTGFSYWWGQGDAYRTKNSAANWTTAQVAFHQEANDVTGFQQKIVLARQQLADFDRAHPNLAGEDGLVGMQDNQNRASLTSNLAGLQQQCLNTVTAYNTASEGFLTADWKDANLPARLDPSVCG